ncbi:MAG: trans-sulfuration enzyme family protein [Gaiellaceae bacterium]
MQRLGLRTRAVHAGRDDLAALGVHAPPIDLSSTYPIHDLARAEDAFGAFARGDVDEREPIYARLHNPTVARFEHALAELEETESAVAFASGMAALTACLLAARATGSHVVAFRPLYGGSDQLLTTGLIGLQVTWIAAPAELPAALRPDTALVVLETPQNPTLGTISIEEVVALAGTVPVLVDNTFATPVLQNPGRHGATLVLHSGTKYLGGHGDVVAGVIATTDDWARRLRRVRIATGGILHPLAAYLLLRGLPTLPLRVERAQATAIELARRLHARREVAHVLYPLADGHQLRGPGSIVSFEVVGGHAAAANVLQRLELVTPAVSLGSFDTLIEHPAGLTHHLLDDDAKLATGISPGLLRLAVGLEDVDDLWSDLAQALTPARVAAVV